MISPVALNMVAGLKPVHRAALLREFGSAEHVFRQNEMDLTQIPEIKSELAYRILHFDMRLAEQEIRRAEKIGLDILCCGNDNYPALLTTIPDPPLVLYCRGRLVPDEPSVALVGSRKATPYGLNVAQYLARDLGKAGITIVSGLARGIDASAHHAAIQSGARTLAVLGSGLDVIYPAEHRNLADSITSQGALISEFPLGTQPNRENFPIRNRIISGLSHVIVVVEASTKSGSLITARMAAEQGREVLAVPGSIFNESSQGCLELIRDGVALVRNWKDVVQALPAHVASHINKDAEDLSADLTEQEKNIIALLSFEQPKHVDQLVGLAGIQSQDLLSVLVNLELKNYITQMPGKQFIRSK